MAKLVNKNYLIGVFIILGLLTLLTGTIASRSFSENSLSEKSIKIQTSSTEINNAVSKLDVSSIDKNSIDSTIIALESIEENITNLSYAYPNSVEKFWFSSEYQSLTKKINETQDNNNSLRMNISEYKNSLESFKQLLNYSAVDDFSQFGIDPNNDSERIARTEDGLSKLESNIKDNEQKILMNQLLDKFDTFINDKNIQNWDLEVKKIQNSLLSILIAKQTLIASEYNKSYNFILYGE